MNVAASGGLKPQLTVLFDVPVEIGLKRARGRGKGRDRMEREKLEFHRRVRRTFLKIARQERRRVLVVDANQGKEKVSAEMIDKLIARLPGPQFHFLKGKTHG